VARPPGGRRSTRWHWHRQSRKHPSPWHLHLRPPCAAGLSTEAGRIRGEGKGGRAPSGDSRCGERHLAILRQPHGPSPFVATDRGSSGLRRTGKAPFPRTQPAPDPSICRNERRCLLGVSHRSEMPPAHPRWQDHPEGGAPGGRSSEVRLLVWRGSVGVTKNTEETRRAHEGGWRRSWCRWVRQAGLRRRFRETRMGTSHRGSSSLGPNQEPFVCPSRLLRALRDPLGVRAQHLRTPMSRRDLEPARPRLPRLLEQVHEHRHGREEVGVRIGGKTLRRQVLRGGGARR